MGIGFQLMDDLLDVYGDQEKFGKQVGGDIVSNKKTYLLITALNLANAKQKATLQDWMERQEYVVEEKVKAVRAVYDEIRIKALTTKKMNEYFDASFAMLEEIEAKQEAKAVLKAFASALMKRES